MYRMKLLDYRPFATLLAVWLITTGVLGYLTIYQGYTHLYAENGLMENLQVFLLCAAFPGFVHTAITTRYPNKTLPWFMALLVFSFVFRELDVDKFDVPELVIFLFAGDGRALANGKPLRDGCSWGSSIWTVPTRGGASPGGARSGRSG